MSTNNIKIGIADDHTLFREGLETLVNSFEGCEVVLQAIHGLDLVEQLAAGAKIDILLLDLKMPEMNGFEVLKHLQEYFPTLKTIVISMHDDIPFILEGIKLGARSYVLKNIESGELQMAIKNTHKVGFYTNHELAKVLMSNLNEKSNVNNLLDNNVKLSEPELELISFLCQGMTSEEIAVSIFRSKRTVEGIKQKLLEKTSSKNTPALVAWAFRHGLIE